MITSDVIAPIIALVAPILGALVAPFIYYMRKNSRKIDILASATIANYEANPSLDVDKLKAELGDAGVTYDDFLIEED